MTFAREKLPSVFVKILDEIEKNGGTMTTEEFKRLIYGLRLTKEDAQDIKRWLNLNGYVMIAHDYHKEVLVLIEKE